MRSAFFTLFLAAALYAQAPAGPEFEVATVRVAAPPAVGQLMRSGTTGGPGTSDPGRFNCYSCPLSYAITLAYNVNRVQLDAPRWMDDQRYDIFAKVPESATKDQMRVMLQHLLADRFKLALRHESRDMQVLELRVGKDGAKMKAADPNLVVAPVAPPTPGSRVPINNDGTVKAPPGAMIFEMVNGSPRATLNAVGETMDSLTNRIASFTRKVVVNKTELTGKYDFILSWSPDLAAMGAPPPPPGPDGRVPEGALTPDGPTLESAIQSQLGLKVESRRGPVDVLVVDHAEKTPTEN